MNKCPNCKNGKQHCKSTEYGTGKVFECDIDCVHCGGTGEVTPEQMEAIEYENNMWCECEEERSFGSYPENGQCQMQGCRVHKHHVHCGTCGKISQVG
jgi:hypothetical protein